MGLTNIANWLYSALRSKRLRPRGRSGIVEHFYDRPEESFKDEFLAVYHRYCYPRDIVSPGRLDEMDRAYGYLQEVAEGDVDEFVATKCHWKLYQDVPVYLIEIGGFMLAFAIAEAHDGTTPVVIAIGCAIREEIEVEPFWRDVVEPRVRMLI